jgi:VWFA-related protein
MNPWRYSIALLCAPLAPASLVLAQTPFAQPSITTTTTTVLIPALIQTRSGAPVFTLTAQNFAVTDDGIPEKITLDENTGSEPIALVVAIQTGGAGAHQLEKYRNLAPLIEALIGNVPHSVALVTFDSQPTLRQPFSTETTQITETLHSLEEGDHGAAILDSLAFSVNLLRDQPPEFRRAILLISETIDRTTDNTIQILSGSKTGTQAGPGSHTTLEQTLRAIDETNTAIYALAFSSAKAAAKDEAPKTLGSSPLYNYQAPPGPPGGCFAKNPNPDPEDSTNRAVQAYDCLSLLAPPLRIAKIAAQLAMNSLQRNVPEAVAHLTGGEYFAFNSERTLQRDLTTLANHVPNRYMLSFHPQSPHPGIHSLSVHLPDYPNLTITARSTYWAEGK